VKQKYQTNTQVDFIEFIISCVEDKHLVEGDILILDNAPIHTGVLVDQILSPILQKAGIEIRFLPTYSPELNPCELVWAFVKNKLRNDRIFTSLNASLAVFFALLGEDKMKSFYKHCIVDVLNTQ
jgi:transposase